MTLIVWKIRIVRVFFLSKSLFAAIWQQFLKMMKVEVIFVPSVDKTRASLSACESRFDFIYNKQAPCF